MAADAPKQRLPVRLLSGAVLEVELDEGATAATLKVALAEKLSLAPVEVQLLAADKEVSDDSLAASLGAEISAVVKPFLPQDIVDALIEQMRAKGIEFGPGLSANEVATAETNCNIIFPPDLKLFLQTATPQGEGFFNWRGTAPGADLNSRFNEGVLFDVEHNEFWFEEWGPQPKDMQEALSAARVALEKCPRLIPIYAHRCMASEPKTAGQPVLSIHQTDIIRYGNDLAHYLAAEFKFDPVREPLEEPVVSIPFWDEIG